MNGAYYDVAGNVQQANITPDIHKDARDAKLSVEHYINRKHADADPKLGTAFQQICASVGLALPGNNAYGIQPATIGDILDGRAGASAALNTADHGTPFGTASRTLFPPAIIAFVEAQMAKDRVTDSIVFDEMVANTIAIPNENFEQPIVDFSTPGGPQSATAQRIAQGAEPATILKFTTSDRIRRLPTFSYGMEFSDQALRTTTLPVVAMMAARFMEVNQDARVYDYLSSLFLGDTDMNTGAISSVNSSTLDAAATGGACTHKAWVKFLARNRKYRRVSHVIGTIGTYLAVEGRAGRPGTVAYDPRLATIDPQANVVNAGFGNDVRWFIVDDYAASGLIPEGEIWALDNRYAITKASNVNANYAVTEQFVMSRSSKMRLDYSEAVYRTYGNTELQAFDRMVLV
jgi:hypothetical protein